ncbi:lauroyl-Kdo(2)-lipid IV(A) myristoyltransferase [Aliivibrio fischeri]|uniref:lauroyl-Kdo(2)-lipid IV(A) myristoyltransferase n=1 Tax=Aliivibrio fischeri TaxID=668 RepID=UPI0012DA235C|nr:lauroyl-Kdo(2)-lipid IV(A) myristoyltransferase [Aliivibrio fischeri]MUL18304.1 lauroyl-Kdo(2)-lipid IV(A) myristoyltransferase [Aliivibrio fischeri]
MTEKIDKNVYNPTFQWAFLHPRYWPTWLGIGFAIILAFIPFRLRDKLAAKIVKLVLKKPSGGIKRAKLNIATCFPEKSEQEQQKLLEDTYITGAQVMLGFSELLVRSRKHNEKRGIFVGGDNLFPLLEQKENIIILAPHAWAIDFPAILLASRGYHVTTMMKPQKNPITDWLMHVQRMQYGGKIYARSAGIKPLIKAIKEGYLAYYLPDEDHGPQNSVFVPFFATQKATLKGFGKLARLSKAKVVPMLPSYNSETGQFEIITLPVIADFPSGDEETDARAMNIAIEQLVTERPEQYMWVLNLLRSRPDGSRLY